MPFILFCTDFWTPLSDFDFLVEQGTISAEDLRLFPRTDDPQDAWDRIREFYQL